MNMITTLEIVERNMPSILMHSKWKSLDVDYHPPHVQRIWTEWNDVRIMLHCFPETCNAENALYHPHPWPSAMRVLEGEYIMEVGHEVFNDIPHTPTPETIATTVMKAGSAYEMTNPKAWHKVIPQKETYTLMVTGPLYEKDDMSLGIEKPTKELGRLDTFTFERILKKFKEFY